MKKFYGILISSLLLTSCQADEPGDINADLDPEPEYEIEIEEDEKTADDSDLESGIEVETEPSGNAGDEETKVETKAELKTEAEAKIETKAESTVREFNMSAQNWSFSPSTITVNEGDTVIIHISGEGNHGFKLAAFGVNETVSSGGTTTVKFVATQKGTFTFSCSVPCGSGHADMSGTLIVS